MGESKVHGAGVLIVVFEVGGGWVGRGREVFVRSLKEKVLDGRGQGRGGGCEGSGVGQGWRECE